MFAKVGGIEYLKKLQDAPIAQIKGGFINWSRIVCESGWDRMFEKITRRADCANKRRIYKLGMRYLRKWVRIEYLKKLQDAPIAQIKGEFINWEWDICESWG